MNNNNILDALAKTTDVAKSFGNRILRETYNHVVIPVMSIRPREIVGDVLQYVVPFGSQTRSCVNHLKRKIRTATYRRDKENGIISFAIHPTKENILLDLNRIDVQQVAEDVNRWLEDENSKPNGQLDGLWPRRIAWVDYEPLKSRIDHGNHFLVVF